jgi:membrane protease YdiL (CAAX protease family)
MNDRLGNTLLFLSRLFMLAGVFLLSQAVFGFLGIALSGKLYGLSYAEVIGLVNHPQLSTEGVYTQRWVQSFNNVGSFLITAIVFVGFYRKTILPTLGFSGRLKPRIIPGLVLLIIPAIFVISGLADFNRRLPGIEQLGNLNELQQHRDAMLNVLLHSFNFWDALILVFTLALIPAVCEEVFFRGLLLPFFSDWTKNKAAGIWISALLFTLLHFSVTQFIPILFMGLVLGYLFVWTRSLWASVMVHFLNNASTVLFHQLSDQHPEVAVLREDYQAPPMIFAASLLLMLLLLFWIRSKRVEADTEALWP